MKSVPAFTDTELAEKRLQAECTDAVLEAKPELRLLIDEIDAQEQVDEPKRWFATLAVREQALTELGFQFDASEKNCAALRVELEDARANEGEEKAAAKKWFGAAKTAAHERDRVRQELGATQTALVNLSNGVMAAIVGGAPKPLNIDYIIDHVKNVVSQLAAAQAREEARNEEMRVWRENCGATTGTPTWKSDESGRVVTVKLSTCEHGFSFPKECEACADTAERMLLIAAGSYREASEAWRASGRKGRTPHVSDPNQAMGFDGRRVMLCRVGRYHLGSFYNSEAWERLLLRGAVVVDGVPPSDPLQDVKTFHPLPDTTFDDITGRERAATNEENDNAGTAIRRQQQVHRARRRLGGAAEEGSGGPGERARDAAQDGGLLPGSEGDGREEGGPEAEEGQASSTARGAEGESSVEHPGAFAIEPGATEALTFPLQIRSGMMKHLRIPKGLLDVDPFIVWAHAMELQRAASEQWGCPSEVVEVDATMRLAMMVDGPTWSGLLHATRQT